MRLGWLIAALLGLLLPAKASAHPLKAQKTITADQLALYPSPALDVGMAPSLMGQLQERSLATAPSGLRVHDWTRWQAAAADGRAVSKQCSSSPSGPALAHAEA